MVHYCQQRRGFTLVELLVVISLMAVLAALAVAFLPNAAATAREARAGTMVQGFFTTAKQRALRDQAPTGVRLWLNPSYTAGSTTLPMAVTDCQYIQQPDDFPGSAGVPIVCPPPTPVAAGYPPLNCVAIGTDILNGYPTPVIVTPLGGNAGDPNLPFWSVQPGDNLEILGTGLMHQIVQIGVPDATGTVQGNWVVVTPPILPNGISSQTMNFRIIRAPRVAGDDMLKLPDSTIIDLNTNNGGIFATPNVLLPMPGYLDILFSPSGEVISPTVASSNIHLWVRAPNPSFPTDVFRGDPTIVSIFTKTGFVGAFPPSSGTPTMPYTLVR